MYKLSNSNFYYNNYTKVFLKRILKFTKLKLYKIYQTI